MRGALRERVDAHFLVALALGPIAWVLLAWWTNSSATSLEFPPRMLREAPWRFVLVVLAYPVLEEFIFRGWLQPAIAARMQHRALPGISAANFVTSTVFAVAHLPFHPPPMALATFFPSLVFGHLRERYGVLWPSIVVHAFYNAGYFTFFG
jgi:hypothetical protein